MARVPTVTPTPADVSAAADRIRGRVRRTPVLEVEQGALVEGCAPVLKLDLLQPTGSFKVRGATNFLRAIDVPEAGVVAASGGNFGLAVAYAARALGVPATVVVPSTSPPEKVAGIAGLGAEVLVAEGFYAAALELSLERASTTGALLAHAYDHPDVVAGQGTCAVELEEQAPHLDTVLVAVGGGGLVGGIASWYAGRVRVVAVETEGCPALHAALEAGAPVDVEVSGLAASSLGARRIGDLGFATAQRFVERALLVTDDEVVEAQRRLWAATRLVAEPGGAAALAALTSGRYRPSAGERVGVVVCGGNADPRAVL